MLFQRYIKHYEITKKHFKGINATMVYLGFPNQYLKTIKEKCSAEKFEITPEKDNIKITGFNAVESYSEWKETLTGKSHFISEPHPDYAPENTSLDITGWIKEEIAKFPLAVKTPFECQQFIYKLQKKLNGTI